MAHRPALNIFRSPLALKADLGTAVCHAGSIPWAQGSSGQPFPEAGAAEPPPSHGCPWTRGFLASPDPCPRSQGPQRVKTKRTLESHPLLLADAKCSLTINFREAKISWVLSRISADEAAGYAQGETQPCQLSKEATEILHRLYIDDTKHTCCDLFSAPFSFLFAAVARVPFQATAAAKEEGWEAQAALDTKLSRWVLSDQV